MNPYFKDWLTQQKFVYLVYGPQGWVIDGRGADWNRVLYLVNSYPTCTHNL